MSQSTVNKQTLPLSSIPLPPVVSHDQWWTTLQKFHEKEKAFTRQRDALNAERRRLPMAKVDKPYLFDGPDGKISLLDMFAGRRQLIVYHFMFGPNDTEGCTGCSMMVDNMGHPAHLHARDISLALVSRAPLEKLNAYKTRMNWTLPWYSSQSSDFNQDFGLVTETGEMFGLSVFVRDGENIYRTYFTCRRGVEHLGSNVSYLDLTPFGRQEAWEDSPDGYPQTPPYQWWRRHDSY